MSNNFVYEPLSTEREASQHTEEITTKASELTINRSSSTKVDIGSLYINSEVKDPQKENDGQNPYISYLIETKSNDPIFAKSEFSIRRRFSDFVFLFQLLVNDYPTSAVPPLPDKKRLEYFKGDRFGSEFTAKRTASLNRFLKRLSLHPVLKRSKIYHIFIESQDWNSYKQNLKIRSDDSGVAADGGIITDVFINAFKTANQQSKEFIAIKERSDKLDENINRIDKIFQKILKRYGDLEQDYFDFSYQIKKISQLEPELELPFIKFSDGLNSLSLGFANLKNFLDNDYLISLKDLEHYISSIKNLIKLKDQKQIDYEALSEYLNRSIGDKEALVHGGGTNFFTNKFEEMTGQNHDLNKREKIHKLENRIERLTKELENSKKVSENFEKQTLNEIQYFENIKSIELKDSLNDLADNNIKFYKDLITKWSDIQQSLG
ncbi:hypothetical protein WICMUC_000672 [Wickerhamomyces mucosus]|uniref:Sorting nexin-4 n=1 Tax=Wickerhamomyces mucosus TaxID=1378264 RepID=A0A9P8PZ41_9ASCO|nr:hypothetical protein WICMUC_000672 [Wickerhamomyces mucosus]